MIWRRVAPVVVIAFLFSAAAAQAGPFGWIFPSESQKNSYSPIRYWAPRAARVNDYVHGPKHSVNPPDRHPEITPSFNNLYFGSAAVDPASTLIKIQQPPATSKFRY
jgi:hypothetical protein